MTQKLLCNGCGHIFEFWLLSSKTIGDQTVDLCDNCLSQVEGRS